MPPSKRTGYQAVSTCPSCGTTDAFAELIFDADDHLVVATAFECAVCGVLTYVPVGATQ